MADVLREHRVFAHEPVPAPNGCSSEAIKSASPGPLLWMNFWDFEADSMPFGGGPVGVLGFGASGGGRDSELAAIVFAHTCFDEPIKVIDVQE